jgi:hypothetical protein
MLSSPLVRLLEVADDELRDEIVRPFREPLNAANFSRLWLGIAAPIFAFSREQIWPDGCRRG